jgi:hypothetical protein
MSRRTLVVGLAVLLIVSTLMVLAGGSAQAQPAPAHRAAASLHPSATTIQLETYGGGDIYYNDTSFTTGSYDTFGYNVLYFGIYDPSGDTKVNFTLSDPNASRDGVGSPAFTASGILNKSTDWYYSYLSASSYTFPTSIVYGGGWVVTASGALGGTVSYNITLYTFETDVYGNPEPYGDGVLPGESVTVDWETYTFANGGIDNHISDVSLDGWYDANGTYSNLFASGIQHLTATGLGSTTFTIPDNATANTRVTFDLWVTIDYNGVVVENESANGYSFGVGVVYIDHVYQADGYPGICPAGNGYNSYDSGEVVQACAEVGALYEDYFYSVPNVPVSLHFWNGASVVTPTGGAPTSLTTNTTGWVSFAFTASNPPFVSDYQYPYYNSFNLTATDPMATTTASNWIDWWNSTFYVYPSAASGIVSVQLGQLEYYAGQTVSATWSLSSTDASATGPLQAVAWFATEESTGYTFAQGTISSSASTGAVSFPLPSGYIGGIYVDVYATNATTGFDGYAYASVAAPQLFLNPSSTTFTPGSTVTVTAVAYGGGSGSTISYQVYSEDELGYSDGGGGLVTSGTVANGSSISIVVPSTAAPGYYYIQALLTGSTGTLAQATLELSQSWGYYVTVGVNTASSYADGSYQPGQTLTIGYQIAPYGDAPLPLFYTFSVSLGGTQVYNTITTTSTSGTFQVTIPSGQPSGIEILNLSLKGTYLEGNACTEGTCFGQTAIVINTHPAYLDMEVGGSSGITVGWLILLILIIVVAIVLGLLIWLKGRPPRAGPAPTASPATPMSPPAPAPSGSAPPEWKEPSSSSPPMPTPPPGAT